MSTQPKPMPTAARRVLVALAGVAATALAACAPGTVRPSAGPPPAAGTAWLERLTYGISSSTLAEYQRLGRAGFLAAQLDDRPAPLPPAIERQIEALEITHADPGQLLQDVAAEYKRINALTGGPDKE